MPLFDVTVEGTTYEVNAPDENTAWRWANYTHRQQQAAKPTAKPESGFLPALRAGATELGGGISALAGKLGLKDEATAQAEYDAAQKRAREIFAPTEAGWTEAPGTKFLELLGGSVPYMAAPLAAGAAAATLPFTGPAALATTLGAAGLTSAAQFTATNLSRQMEEGKKLAETDLGNAALAAVPQAALDTLSLRLIPGIGRIFGQAGIKVTAENAKEIAEQGLKKVLIDYTAATGKTMGAGGLTEAAQQVLERAQAGLSLTDPKAREEYFDSFLGGAVLSGTLAVPGRYYERSKAQGEARTLLEGQEAEQRKAAREAAEAEKKSPEYLETRYDAYQKLSTEIAALQAQLKKESKEAPLSQEDKDANAVIQQQLGPLKEQEKAARKEFIAAGGPQAVAKLKEGRLELTPPSAEAPAASEKALRATFERAQAAGDTSTAEYARRELERLQQAAPEAPEVARPRYEREVRGLTNVLEQQRAQMAAAESPEDAVRIAEQARRTKTALDAAQDALGKLPAAPDTAAIQDELKKLEKRFDKAKAAGNQDEVLKHGTKLLELRKQLQEAAPSAQLDLFAPEAIAAEQARRDALGEEMAAGRETAGYERKQTELEQQVAREEAVRRAAVEEALTAEGVAEREAMAELGQRLAQQQRGREMARVRTAPQLALFPEARERVEQETTVPEGEVRRLQEQIAELEKRRAEKEALPQEELAGALSREPGQITDIDRQLAAMRQRLDDLREGEMERRTVRMPPEAPQVDVRPQPPLTQRIAAMADRVLAAPGIDEGTKDVVRQMQADLPAFLRRAKAPPTAAWLYRTLTTGRADPADTARARDALRTLEEAKRSETETLPSGEIRRAVQPEFPEMPEPRATAFNTYEEFENYLAKAAPMMVDAQGRVALSVSRLQRELAPLREQAAELRKQEADLKQKVAALKEKTGAERAAAQALVNEAQFSLSIARNALDNVIEQVIAARAAAVQKYSDGLTEGIRILLDIADGVKQFDAEIAAREPVQVSSIQRRREALETRRAEQQEKLSTITEAAEKSKVEADLQRIEKRLSALPKGYLFDSATVFSGDLPGYTAAREAEKKVEKALDEWAAAQTNMRDVVQRNVGADWSDSSTALGEYLVAKKRVDAAGKTVWNAKNELRKLAKDRKGVTPLPDEAFGDFLVKQAELAAKLDVELKRISGLSKYVKGIAKNAEVDAYLKQRDAAQVAFSKALRELPEGGDVGALLRNHMKPLEAAKTALADTLSTYGGTSEQIAAFNKAQADFKAAETLLTEVAVATRPDDAQAEQLLAAAKTAAVQAGRLEGRVESRLAAARARAEARTRVAPTPAETTLAQREAADAAKRRAEQASLEAGERSGVMVFFEKNKEDIMADTNYIKLVEQAYDRNLSSAERMQAATEADKYMQAKRARIESRAEKTSAASVLHEENLNKARAKLAELQGLRGKKRSEKTAAKLEDSIKKQEAVIAGHQAKLNKSLTGTQITRMTRAQLKAVRDQANAEISRTRVAGERLGVAEGTQARAIGPATRPEVMAPKTLRTGTEESVAGETTTPSKNRIQEARGVRQRDVAMSKKEIAEANLIAAENAVGVAKTPSEKRLAEAQLAVAEIRYEIAAKGDSNTRAQQLSEAEGEVQRLLRVGMAPVERTPLTASEEAEIAKELEETPEVEGAQTTEQKVDSFLKSLKKITKPSKKEKGLRAFGEVDVDIKKGIFPAPNKSIYISLIRNNGAEGKGAASTVLKKLMALADTHGVTLTLQPEQVGAKGLSTEQLEAWYARSGFKSWDGGMYREPKKQGETVEELTYEAPEIGVLGGTREEAFFSRGPTATPSTTGTVRTELKQTFPDLGRVQIYDSVDALVAANPQYKGKIPADARGFVDSAGNKAFLIAENINQGQALSVLLHEVGAHVGLKSMLGDAQYSALVNAVKSWEKRTDNSPEARVAQAARARVEAAETPAGQVNDELLAYAIEEAVNAGVKPMETKGVLGQWLSRVAALFRRALEKFGLPPKALDAQGLVDMAFGAAKMEMGFSVPKGKLSRIDTYEDAKNHDARLLRQVEQFLLTGTPVSAPTTLYRGGTAVGQAYTHATPWAAVAAKAGKLLGYDPKKPEPVYEYKAAEDQKYYRGGALEGDPLETTRIHNAKGMTWGQALNAAKKLFDAEVRALSKRYTDAYLADPENKQDAIEAVAGQVTEDFFNAVYETDAANKPGVWANRKVPDELMQDTPKLRKTAPGEILFSRNLPTAARVANQLVGKEKGVIDKIRDNFLGIGGRAQFIDKYFPTEEALKRAGADPTKAMQAMYYLRMVDQQMHFTSQAITDGVPERREIIRPDGTKEYLIEAKPGANLKQAYDILKRKDVVKEAGSADAANKLVTLYMAAIRGERVGYDTLNFGRVWAQGEIKRIENELKSPKLSAEQRTVLTKRMNRLESRLDSMPTPEDIKAAKAEIDANPVLRDAFSEVRDIYNQYNRDLINFNVQTGALSKEQANKLLQENDYIPYYRMRDGVAELIIGKETPIRIGNLKDSPHLQELVGGDEPIMDFITSSIQNTSMLIDMATHNLAMKNLMFEFKDLGLATVGKVKGGNAPTGAVTFKLDGVEHFGVVDTEALGISSDLLVKGLAGIPTMFPAFVRVMGMPARFLRRMIVASPLYMARQLFRDSLAASIASGSNTVPVLGALKQIGKAGALERRGITGGQVFTGMPEDQARMIKDMQAGKLSITNGLAYLEGKAAQVDALTRRSQYEDYLKQGLSEMEATYMALESMNFSRRGLSPSVHMASTLIPFFNAQIQGLDVLYRSFTGQMPMNERLGVRKKLIARGMMLFGLSIAYALAMQDDEAYKNAKPEEKYGNWFVNLPGVEQPIRLPIPFELGYIFKALPEAIVNTLANEEGGEEALKALKHIVQQMIPGGSSYMIPAAVKPLLEVGFGVSAYTGRDIESAREQAIEPGYRARESTTELAKAVGEMTGFSPIKLEFLISGYTGQMGMALISALSAPFAGTGEGPAPATKRPSDLPLVGTLFQPKDASGIIDLVYERMNKVRQVQETYKRMLAENKPEQAKRYAEEKADELSLASVAGAFREQMGQITEFERQVRASTLTPDRKRAELDRARQAKIRLAQAVQGLSGRTAPQAARP